MDFVQIPKALANALDRLGIGYNWVRSHNVGSSDYSKHLIQPWAIWLDYDLNAWDADIIKRVLRTKGSTKEEQLENRCSDYLKIKHICDERLRQLKQGIC